MKVKILQESAPIYSQIETESMPIRTLQKGEIAELGKIQKARGKQWVETTLPDGTHGFLAGETRTFSLIQATTNQRKTSLYGTAARGTPILELKKGTLLDFQDMVELNGEQWIYVRDAAGNQGYIEGKTNILRKTKVTKKTGKSNMLVGGAFFVIGTIITISTYSSATSGGNYYICWGAIIFGAIQFIQGLIQFLTAPE